MWLQKIRDNLIIKKTIQIASVVMMGLYVFSICFFSGRQSYYFLSYLPAGFMCAFSFAYILIYKHFVLDWKLLPPIVFTFLVLTSSIVNKSSDFEKIRTLILMWIIFIFVYFSINAFTNKTIVLYALLIPIVIFGIIFALYYRNEVFSLDLNVRIGGAFGNVNDVSMNLAYGIIFSLLLIVFKKHYWLIPISLFLFYLCLFAESKKTIVAPLMVLVFVIAFAFRKNKLIFLVIAILLIGLLTILFNLPAFVNIRERFIDMLISIFNGGSDDSTSLRKIYFETGLYYGFQNFLIGFGNEGFRAITSYNTYSHSNLSEILCNFGFLGFLAFYFIYPYLLLFNKKQREYEKCFNICFIVVFAFYSFTSVYFDSKMYYIMLAVAVSFSSKIDIRDVIKNKGIPNDFYKPLDYFELTI